MPTRFRIAERLADEDLTLCGPGQLPPKKITIAIDNPEPGVRHDVEAIEESAFLLTVAGAGGAPV